jgi:hypothetical protein
LVWALSFIGSGRSYAVVAQLHPLQGNSDSLEDVPEGLVAFMEDTPSSNALSFRESNLAETR